MLTRSRGLSPSSISTARKSSGSKTTESFRCQQSLETGHAIRSRSPRTDLKPLNVTQEDGASFTVNGHEVRWQKWALRVGFNPREGLILNTVAYDGRPIMYRGSIAEMIVPYADPRESSYRKNAFDLGEYGVGMMANSLALGCDCLGTIQYFDGHMADGQGRPVTIKNAICLHEEDFGMLWKHTDWRTNQTEGRRSRRLAVSMIATVGNYDYGFYWYFYQDGSIQLEVKLTGIINTMALKPGESPRYGVEVAPRCDGPKPPTFLQCPVRHGHRRRAKHGARSQYAKRSTGSGESPRQRIRRGGDANAYRKRPPSEIPIHSSARFWRVVNPARTNELGGTVGYRLCPGESVLPHAQPDAAVLGRAAFLTKNLWVTPFQATERFPAGDYPNQSKGGDGLPAWTQSDRNIAATDLVALVHFRPDAHPARRRLARDAGDLGRFFPPPGRVL